MPKEILMGFMIKSDMAADVHTKQSAENNQNLDKLNIQYSPEGFVQVLDLLERGPEPDALARLKDTNKLPWKKV